MEFQVIFYYKKIITTFFEKEINQYKIIFWSKKKQKIYILCVNILLSKLHSSLLRVA